MFELRHHGNTAVIVCSKLESLGFINGFSTRLGGVSPLPESALNLGHFGGDTHENVDENRRRFLTVLNAGEYPLHTLKQVHSALVHQAHPQDVTGPKREGDALVGQEAGKLVGVLTADCLPVLIVDPTTQAYTAIHAGWRGTLQRITEQAIQTLSETFGTVPADCHVALGPCATVAQYEVGDELVDQFREVFHQAADTFFQRPAGSRKAHLDVQAANLHQLATAGIPRDQIYISEYCTMQRNDWFFSYRCEKETGQVGRLLSVVGRKL